MLNRPQDAPHLNIKECPGRHYCQDHIHTFLAHSFVVKRESPATLAGLRLHVARNRHSWLVGSSWRLNVLLPSLTSGPRRIKPLHTGQLTLSECSIGTFNIGKSSRAARHAFKGAGGLSRNSGIGIPARGISATSCLAPQPTARRLAPASRRGSCGSGKAIELSQTRWRGRGARGKRAVDKS